jgi:hypothetical protein
MTQSGQIWGKSGHCAIYFPITFIGYAARREKNALVWWQGSNMGAVYKTHSCGGKAAIHRI